MSHRVWWALGSIVGLSVAVSACSGTSGDEVAGGAGGGASGAAGTAGGAGGAGNGGASGSGAGVGATGGAAGSGGVAGAAGSVAGASGSGAGASGAQSAGGAAGVSGVAGLSGAGSGGSAGAGAGGVSGAGSGGTAGVGGDGGGMGPFACPAGPFEAPLPASPTLTKVMGVPPAGFGQGSSSNVEGPVWNDGRLYVSHIQEGVTNPPPARILRIFGTTVEEFMPMSGTNGMAAIQGGLLVARHEDGSISSIDLNTKAITVVADRYMNARFDSPNDLARKKDGNIYFSDPDFQAPSTRPQAQTRVYRIDPNRAVTVVDATIGNPNGVTLAIDEKKLFVSTSGNLYSFLVNDDGSVGARSMINGVGGADGMAIDCAGNLYLTQERDIVVVSSATGMEIGRIANAVPNDASTTNAAFGGDDHKRLFVTARGNGAGLWYVDLNVPGMAY